MIHLACDLCGTNISSSRGVFGGVVTELQELSAQYKVDGCNELCAGCIKQANDYLFSIRRRQAVDAEKKMREWLRERKGDKIEVTSLEDKERRYIDPLTGEDIE